MSTDGFSRIGDQTGADVVQYLNDAVDVPLHPSIGIPRFVSGSGDGPVLDQELKTSRAPQPLHPQRAATAWRPHHQARAAL